MVNYIVFVTTREGDKFNGIYPSLPTRDEVIEGIRKGNDPVTISRLLLIVKSTKNWPTRVIGRHVEVVRDEAIIMGKVLFDIKRG
jgi:hypothetical protein